MTTILSRESSMPSLAGATEWLNSEPLTPADLRGRVVLVDFGTYTCINWLRTLPHMRAWAEKYREDGLVVVGIQTPEFEFEQNLDSVRREVEARANRLAGSPSTTATRSGGRSATGTGPPCTSSIAKGSSAITTLAKGGMSSLSGRSRSCSASRRRTS